MEVTGETLRGRGRFMEKVFTRCTVINGEFKNCNFEGCVIRDGAFERCVFERCDFHAGVVKDSRIIGSKFKGSTILFRTVMLGE